MNAAKMKQVEIGLTGIARKVLDAVPIADSWQPHTIASEIKRATGSAPEIKIVNGCLESLKASGLVREPTRGKWIRVCAKERTEAREAPNIAVESNVLDMNRILTAVDVASVDRKPVGPMDRLAAVAGELRSLAHVVEEIACDVEQSMQQANEKTAKLRQLQELLRGLGQ